MQKFNVGDKVKVSGGGSKCCWSSGLIGEIVCYDNDYNTCCVYYANGMELWRSPDNLELVEPAVQANPSAQQQVVTNNTTSELLTIEQAIHLLKSNGYKVYKEM